MVPLIGHPTKRLVLSETHQDGLQVDGREAFWSKSRGQGGFDSQEQGQMEADASRWNV